LAKGSVKTIAPFFIVSLMLSFGLLINSGVLLIILILVSWALSLFVVYFFRDPNRRLPTGEKSIVSPADGKIILIETEQSHPFFTGSVIKLSIFMSVFDVHVNRYPVSGKIIHFNYSEGKFLPAYQDGASFENEQTTIVIEGDALKILFKQIAGIIARRIVCHAREGARVEMGERCGMIKFGSRVDMVMPASVNLNVKLNDTVRAGHTIIGAY
jgi:phosphatidylserine decarboxylase